MSDYIKRIDAIDSVRGLVGYKRYAVGRFVTLCEKQDAITEIRAIPSADVVERKTYQEKWNALATECMERERVVRCRDCKYWHKYIDIENGQGWCGNDRIGLVVHSGWTTHEDFYCADGERKDNE